MSQWAGSLTSPTEHTQPQIIKTGMVVIIHFITAPGKCLKTKTAAIKPRTRRRVQFFQAGKVSRGVVSSLVSSIRHLSNSLDIETTQSINSVGEFDHFVPHENNVQIKNNNTLRRISNNSYCPPLLYYKNELLVRIASKQNDTLCKNLYKALYSCR